MCTSSVKTEKLLCQLREHCSEWKSKLGSQLIFDTKQMISSTSSTIRVRLFTCLYKIDLFSFTRFY